MTPSTPGCDVYDVNLNNIGPDPIPSGHRKRLTDLEAQTSRVISTSSRFVVELEFGAHGRYEILCKHNGILYQFLQPLGNMVPYMKSQPKINMLDFFAWCQDSRYKSPFMQSQPLPPGYTYRTLGATMVSRIEMRNPYDSLGKSIVLIAKLRPNLTEALLRV